jgi:hypothetical protein
MEATMTTQISKLQKASLKELREKYAEVFGKPTKSRNAKWLFTKIAKKLQDADEEPDSAKKPVALPTLVAKYERKKKGRSKRVPKPKAESKDGKRSKQQFREAGQRDPRLPKPGTTLERVYKGKKLLVRVLEDGFEYEGRPFKSLSALAQHITGAKAINGYLWFRLGKYAKPKKESESK